jgi:hypothetical protein
MPSTVEHTATSPQSAKPIVLGILAIATIYLLQIYSPLRLVNDGVVYLSLATSAVDGHGFIYHGAPEQYPLGYPALIYLLVKMGLGHAWAFNALNCLFLGLAIVAAYHILRASLAMTREKALRLCAMTMLSFIVVKHVTQMVSDTVFFGASMSCLWALVWAEQAEQTRRRHVRCALAFGLAVFATSVRAIGIALLPAIVFVALGGAPALQRWAEKLRQRRRAAVIATLGLLLLAVVGVFVITRTQYFHMALSSYRARGVSRSVTKALEFQLGEWGEFLANLPQAKLPAPLQPFIFLVGLMAMALAAAGIWKRRRNLGALEVYLFGYLLTLLAAPWQDARYLLPVIPLLLGYLAVFTEDLPKHRFVRFALATYVVYFFLLGIAALVYSTRITFSGRSFPDLYGDGTIRATYRAAYREPSDPAAGQVNPDALDLLLRYDPRFRR